ncbi:MAG: adenylosuccinate lyase [Candidatus Latescibacteria bacterium]|nr:adenylosuccinate lyase [Candidatus Latescibacterota bacterium]
MSDTESFNVYQNPLPTRYASREMSENFSERRRSILYRDLWIALAEAEQTLGLSITDEQIEEMRRFREEINFDAISKKEQEIRHDVMAHIYAYGLQCPNAKPIIHLGATSAYVGDNADLIQMREGLRILLKRIVNILAALKDFAMRWKDLPTLGFTHFQPAQLTTVGKRATLWMQDLLLDLEDIEHRLKTLRFRGVKGTTGTQASFMVLFDGDEAKVKALDQMVTERMGFSESFAVTGQTYPRKVDSQVARLLAGLSESAHKFANDIRLLQGMKEVEEPFEEEQVGSSAMAYKRNPMRCERISSLARFVIATAQSLEFTAATQWFERTLDDSANKRITIPETFLATDALLILYQNVAGGLIVYERMIERQIERELPFMATEEFMQDAVRHGGDRQELHRRIRRYAIEAGRVVKEEGGENDLLHRIAADPAFGLSAIDLQRLTDPRRFIGRAPGQTVDFIERLIDPVLDRYTNLLESEEEVRV